MDVREPFAVVTPTLDGPVLRVLAAAAAPLTTHQVINLCATGSPAGIRKVLRRLADQGIAVEARVGKTYTYEANRDHLAWPAVEHLSTLMQRLDQHIRTAVEQWAIQPLSVELFGSAARGEAAQDSDIDILVVAPSLATDELDTWETQTSDLHDAVAQWTGNSVEVLTLTPDELVDMVAENAPAVTERRRPIAGVPTTDLLPRSFAHTLSTKTFTPSVAKALNAQLTPSTARLIAELAPTFTDELPQPLKASLNEMAPKLQLSRNARAALHGTTGP
ncbi:nucleotidyltransferase domain-containing protein [Aeromicrobium sp. CTD01-1L150]|uniref:nucleotidyltransferase domain-containing protein n=1 Tax=Aeromicrobium sp. CTD01-1L150 TaxID=3341830 RepID=UPI0035C13947